MKVFAFAIAALLAGVAAVPDVQLSTNERFIDGIISGVIEDLSNTIKERGLDPYNLEKASFSYTLPVTDLLVVEAAVEKVFLEGLSNIRINRINFSILASRLQLDVSLPLIKGSVGSANADVKFFSSDMNAAASGSLEIEEIRVVADVRVNVGIISGISIRSISVQLTIKDVRSNLKIVLFGRDLSKTINTFLGTTVHESIRKHSSQISELLEHIIKQVVEDLL